MGLQRVALSVKEVSFLIGVSKSTIYNWLNARSRYFNPDFPNPIRFGARSVRWRMADINNFLMRKPMKSIEIKKEGECHAS